MVQVICPKLFNFNFSLLMMKKIGILTQPLHDNYGGLLQAYALKKTLESLSFNVEILNRRKPYHSLKYSLGRILSKLRGRKVSYQLSKNEKEIISRNTNFFAAKHIKNITSPIFNTSGLVKMRNKYDFIVVGSDQVWKPSYSPKISNYFLDFLDQDQIVGLAYAASFGGEDWTFSPSQTVTCKENIFKFKAISVREDSGIRLCRDYFGVDATHVLDPTMLLTRNDYLTLIRAEDEEIYEKNTLVHYVLDKTADKSSLISEIASKLTLSMKSLTQPKKPTRENIKESIEDCVYPRVTAWINGFCNASFIVTDSFHGTVFSILFNKPFVVVANSKRGNARFFSLLKMFGLEDRLLLDISSFSIEDINGLKEIDWNAVNSVLQKSRKISMDFLISNLQD